MVNHAFVVPQPKGMQPVSTFSVKIIITARDHKDEHTTLHNPSIYICKTSKTSTAISDFIITHLTNAIILRSWAHDDDLARCLESILTAVTGINQKLRDRFDAAATELRNSSQEDYRWISLMKVGEALG
ncbi:hypothetical protein DOTSEDRAFT_21791 [Dothistroma septosporum NZE10]|uniref:Uncharacterized protein n=1 Tax=Dothistroma septosporum (strain NZE10 / CBS 128990) TaxID=675120 RepID=N1Q0U5_DOTSN|nr:hypothetical protein DOTSEDRAFT_21791 [Dothistroma septosporum NZE10]